ncbi:MAG: accessory Sec system translocase SecA2 [Holophagae bacterium]|jgi:preprotein translocase subunit SecA
MAELTPSWWQRVTRWTGSPVDHDLRSFAEDVAAIAALEPEVECLDDHEITESAEQLRDEIAAGVDPALKLHRVFAMTREAARRRLDERPFDEQLIGGIALARGRIAEMQTGEGKTLAAVAPAAMEALPGRGVHVLTVNDYLARRDAAWMGPVYEMLGLTVGCIQEGMRPAARRAAYACDVTYLTAKEAGFDLLRDGLCLDRADLVHRPFNLAIVDEADSILIDEARVPLVIAGTTDEVISDPGRLSQMVCSLERGRDWDLDEYSRNVNLTEAGSRRVEELLSIDNLFDSKHLSTLAAVQNALHAEVLLRRDVDYIVRNARAELVDELTGRVVEDRQWPDGLQAAVEAKEGLHPQPEGRVLGSITMQHLLLQYPRLAGMTATARPAARELHDCYGLEVTVVPTHAACVRVDADDLVFTDKAAKQRALIREISLVHETGRPILVGTTSVAESEDLAEHVRAAGIECRVLNAKNDEVEAAVVAEAGRIGAVTISTNMAGRGTDIRLGSGSRDEHDEVVSLGGLYVIGTNRHESRRIDDQLRGRAGRQGDPGESRFFVSLEDDLLVRFGLRELLPKGGWPATQDGPVDDPMLMREIRRAQRVVDGQNFDTRTTLRRYADVIEAQRSYVQSWRRRILEGDEQSGILVGSERRQDALARVGEEALDEIERRLTLVTIDRCWCDYLEEMRRARDGIHFVSLGGRAPYEVFHEHARAAFEATLERVVDEAVSIFERIRITDAGVDWAREGLLGPSSTWTYMVTDMPFATGPLAAMANRQSWGLLVAWMYWPLWIAWGFYRRWKDERARAKGEVASGGG